MTIRPLPEGLPVESGATLLDDVDDEARFDDIVDAAGSQSALDLAIERAQSGGRIVSLGRRGWDAHMNELALISEIPLLPSVLYRSDELDRAAAPLRAQPELTDLLVSHRLPLSEAVRGFEIAADAKGSQANKVQLVP